jgi:hypothetical protein
MYNTNVVCTYNTPEVFLETDNITNEEKEFVRNAIYRQELLDILEIEDYNEIDIETAIHTVYERVKDCKELYECMLKAAGQFTSIEAEFGLIILFAYDYMYLTHICISEYLHSGKISQNNEVNLQAILF